MVEEALIIKGKFHNELPDSLEVELDGKKNWKLLDINELILSYFQKFIPSEQNFYILISNDIDHLNNLPCNIRNIIYTRKVNDFCHINKFFNTINNKLIVGGMFIGSVDTYEKRKRRKLQKFPYLIYYPYYFLDSILKRIFPKNSLTKGVDRTLSLAETFERLLACGFQIVHREEINNRLYFISKKVRKPIYDPRP